MNLKVGEVEEILMNIFLNERGLVLSPDKFKLLALKPKK
jgi:hypothetical protein